MKVNNHTYIAGTEEDYAKLNLKVQSYGLWEDGMRTNGRPGSYEWWYFDAHLTDGSKIVIVFYTKPMTDVNKPLKPYATVNIDYSDGTKMERYLPSDEFAASIENCDVRIGPCFLKGDLKNYTIHMEDGDGFVLDATFSSCSQSWRPQTGHFYFGNEDNKFSWFVAMPNGETKVNYKFGDKVIEAEGRCYHDHNWGNKSLHKLVNHWYWSRSEFGPYTVIACQIVPEKKYGSESINLFYVSKNGELITDDATKMEFAKSLPVMSNVVKKPVSDEITFEYMDSDISIGLTLKRNKNILETYLIQDENRRKLIKFFTGFNGGYFRFTGEAILKIRQKNSFEEIKKNDHAIWELMYFGNPI